MFVLFWESEDEDDDAEDDDDEDEVADDIDVDAFELGDDFFASVNIVWDLEN